MKNHHGSKAAWESKKFMMCVFGILAIVAVVGLCVLETALVPAVAAAGPAIAGIVATYCHKQGNLDMQDTGSITG